MSQISKSRELLHLIQSEVHRPIVPYPALPAPLNDRRSVLYPSQNRILGPHAMGPIQYGIAILQFVVVVAND